LQVSGEIDTVEAARRIKEGPPVGTKEVEANGAANGAGAMEATDQTHGALKMSWKEIASKIKYCKTILFRLKKYPESTKEMIEHTQKLITDLEAKRDAATPPQARIAQFDQKIRNAEWYKEGAEEKFAETIEHITYFQNLKVEAGTELDDTTKQFEKLKKEKWFHVSGWS